MRTHVIAALFLGSLAACGSDAVGPSMCPAGEFRSPITSECVASGADTGADMPDPDRPDAGPTPDVAGCTENCAPIRFEPSALEFTYTPALEPGTREVVFLNEVDSAFVVGEVVVEGSSEFHVDGITEGDSIIGLGSRLASVSFVPTDRTDDIATLRVFDQAGQVAASIALSSLIVGTDVCASNCPRIVIDPASILFSYTPGAGRMERDVIVGNVGDGELNVTEALLLQQGREFEVVAAVPATIQPGRTATWTIAFTPAALDRATLKVRSNDPWQPEVDVPIRATSKVAGNDPCIEVVPTSLDFGTVQRGDVRTLSFTVSNCAMLDLTVSDIRRGTFFGIPTTQAFSIGNGGTTPITIAAGASKVIEVKYAPRRAGIDSGFFTVISNSMDTPSVRVNVRGRAEPPPLSEIDIHVRLSWDTDGTDVDMHMLDMPGGKMWCNSDVFFSNPDPDWGVAGDFVDDPFLDVDDVDGYGPENINLEKAQDGHSYKVMMQYWRDSDGNGFSTDTDATVQLFVRGVQVGSWGPQTLNGTGDTWDVFEIAWPSRTVTTLGPPLRNVPSSVSCQP